MKFTRTAIDAQDYIVTTELRSSDNDALGVMFRYTGTSNYCRFSMDSERSNRRLNPHHEARWLAAHVM
jgi:hypothetical protein